MPRNYPDSVKTVLTLPKGKWLVIGVDPGRSGAVSFLGSGGFADGRVVDTKVAKDLQTALVELAESSDAFYDGSAPGIRRFYVEDVHSMPGEGHVGVFSFGQAKAMPRGLLSATYGWQSEELIAPQAWQRICFGEKLVGMDGDERKEAIRLAAIKKWPAASLERKKDEAVAAALYIALCGVYTKGW